MENFLRADNARNLLPGSPTNSFIADEVASICPLITPSPPTNDLINASAETTEPGFEIGEELADKLQKVKDNEKVEGDSASSNSSVLAEPVCTQLLNHRNVYHHITKDEETVTQESNGKTQPLQLTFKNPPDNYFFMSWNWPIIRRVSQWLFMACLAAMVALVVAMIATLPKTCNPAVEWYHGSLSYEIFPASFYSPTNGMIGDFHGISRKVDYLKSLGVRSVRLNSIFESPNYPYDYKNATSLLNIAKPLGDLESFQRMVHHLHSKNISVILDIPIWPVVKELTQTDVPEISHNETGVKGSIEFLSSTSVVEPIDEALLHWSKNGVDGFYLKGLEHFTNDLNIGKTLRRWKKVVGPNRIFIVSENVVNNIPKIASNLVLNHVDLVEVRLKIDQGTSEVTKQIENIQNSTLFLKPGMPWVMWTLGNENLERLANRLHFGNATLGATLLQLMLPGTPSIFYGDEVGLQQVPDPQGERADEKHLHHLTRMTWSSKPQKSLSWNHGGEQTNANFDQIRLIKKMAALRAESPSIYMNSVYKLGETKANSEVKFSREDLLVLQRWFPRRKSYVVVSNFGKNQITADLSTLLYTGEVVVGPKPDSTSGTISFKDISLWPGESVVIVLD